MTVNLEDQLEQIERRALAILADHDFGVVPLEYGSRFRRCLPNSVIQSGDYATIVVSDPSDRADLPSDMEPLLRDAASALTAIDCLKLALEIDDARLAMRSGLHLGRMIKRLGVDIPHYEAESTRSLSNKTG